MASMIKRGNSWRVYVARKGVKVSESFECGCAGKRCGCGAKERAETWGTTREQEILEGAGVVRGKHSVQAMLETFLRDEVPKRGNVVWETMRINAWLGTKAEESRFDCKLDFLTHDLRSVEALQNKLSDWISDRLDVVSSGTVRREMNLLSPIFNHYRRPPFRWLQVNPLTDITKPDDSEPRKVLWPDTSRDAIATKLGYVEGQQPRTMKQETAYIFLLALHTAMRSSEIIGIQRRNVDLANKKVHLPETKNGESRDVPMSPIAIELFTILMDMPTNIDGRLFSVDDGSRDTLFREARKDAKIPQVWDGKRDVTLRFHDSRANALTYWAKRMDVMTLSRVSGHKDINILNKHYYRVSATDVAEIMAKAEPPRLRLVRGNS